MNRLVLLSIFSLLSIITNAQYVVFSSDGDVKHKTPSTQWTKVKKNQMMDVRDSIYIGDNAKLQVLNTNSSLIFESTKQGKYSLLQLVNHARKQSGRVIAELHREMYNNARNNNKSHHTFVGASTRGDENLFTDTLYSYLQSYVDWSLNNEEKITVSVNKRKRLMFFEFDNKTEEGLFINILAINTKTNKKSCTYVLDASLENESCIHIAPGSKLSLEYITFLSSKNIQWLLFATRQPYNSEHLQNLFEHNVTPIKLSKDDIFVITQKINMR